MCCRDTIESVTDVGEVLLASKKSVVEGLGPITSVKFPMSVEISTEAGKIVCNQCLCLCWLLHIYILNFIVYVMYCFSKWVCYILTKKLNLCMTPWPYCFSKCSFVYKFCNIYIFGGFMVSANRFAYKNEPSIEKVKVLAYISCLRCYHSSETRVTLHDTLTILFF